MRKTIQATFLVSLTFAVLVFATVGCQKKDSSEAVPVADSAGVASGAATAEDITPTNAENLVLAERPSVEADFIAIVSRAQAGEREAKNDMQRGGVKAERDTALCKLLSGVKIQDWTGHVSSVDANSDGMGVFQVEIANDVFLQTWNNGISDSGDHTLIAPGSEVFKAAANMEKGTAVRVSGTLLAGFSGDCIKEGSLTLRGKLRDPGFIFRFDRVSVLTNSAAPKEITRAASAVEQSALPSAPVSIASPDSNARQTTANALGLDGRASDEESRHQPSGDASSVAGEGPSFDCSKASTRVENLICTTPELAAADSNLAFAYRTALRHSQNKARLKDFQKDWIQYNRNRCSDVGCLLNSYQSRLRSIQEEQ